jgi:MFS family permease
MREPTARRIYRNPVLYTVGIGYFLVQASLTPIALVLPSMGRAFGVGLAKAGWVQSAYLLALTALMLPCGRLGDLLGHRRIFAYGMGVLAAATVAAPFAPSFRWFVALRCLQGVGGAMATGTSLAVIAQEFPAAHHGRTMGMVTMMSSFGAVMSLLLTGLLMERMGWQAAFLIVVPFAVAGAAAVIPFWRSRPAVAPAPVDLPGLCLLALTVLGLYLTVSPVSAAGLSDLFQPVMGLVTVASGAALLWWERRATNPVFEVRLLWRGGLAPALGAHCAYHMSMMVMIFSMPFFMERVLALPASRAAGILLPMLMLTTGMAFVGGWMYDRTRSPWLSPASLLAVCLGMVTLGYYSGSLPYAGILAVTAVIGAAGGAFMTTNNTGIMAAAGAGLHGFASGMLETLRQLGHGLAVPILTASLGAGAAAAAPPEGPAFAAGFRSAMLVMGSIVFVGVLLAMSRRATVRQVPAETPAPIVASS